MDYKSAAAGDDMNQQSNERSGSSERTGQRSGVPLEFAQEVLEYLMSFTQASLTVEDQKKWVQRLSMVPAWKLKKLDEFTSPFIGEVWKFLDALQPPVEHFKSLPEPDPTPRSAQVARDFLAHIQKILNWIGTREERLRWEMESLKVLDKKYPHLNIWHDLRNEKRFKDLQ